MSPQVEMMSGIVKKLPLFEEDLLTERKPLTFLALFSRDYSELKYDLVVAAPWIDQDKKRGIAHVAETLHHHLNSEEILAISRIVVIEATNPLLADYTNEYLLSEAGQRPVAVAKQNFFGLDMQMAILFRPAKAFDHREGVPTA